ncbi:MAG: DUF2254 domain-containing protein [Spirochaetaceae bacterium]
MHARLGKVRSLLRYSFWFIPAIISLAFAILSLVLTETEFAGSLPRVEWVSSLGRQGIRDLLVMIASSMITVATTAFSIIIVALQLASGQLGPRLLRNFIKDRGNQLVFGAFLGTFVYSVLLLRRIGEEGGTSPGNQVPHSAVLLAVVFGLSAVGVLIYFIHHAASSIQKDNVISRVSDELVNSLEKLYPKTIGQEPPFVSDGTAQQLPRRAIDSWENGCEVSLSGGGYVQAVDAAKLMKTAVTHDLCIYLARGPGEFIYHDAVVARVVPADAVTPKVERSLRDVFILGTERTAQQDVAFVFEQLVEIALRALSPGTVDSFTAIRCIDRLADALALVARTPVPSPYRFDSSGLLRVVTQPVNFNALVTLALYPVAEAAAHHTNVMVRLFESARQIGVSCAQTHEREVLKRLNDYLLETSRAADGNRPSYADFAAFHDQAAKAISGGTVGSAAAGLPAQERHSRESKTY